MSTPGPTQTRIEALLAQAFELQHLQVLNESGNHNVPAGSETHFKVVLVAQQFAGSTRLARHRQVNGVLAEELAGGVHALSVHAHSPAEWTKRFAEVPMSPPCLGGEGASAEGQRADGAQRATEHPGNA